MANAIIPTWSEVNAWVVLGIAALIFIAWVWVKGKREEERTVTWIRDWNEPNIKEEW